MKQNESQRRFFAAYSPWTKPAAITTGTNSGIKNNAELGAFSYVSWFSIRLKYVKLALGRKAMGLGNTDAKSGCHRHVCSYARCYQQHHAANTQMLLLGRRMSARSCLEYRSPSRHQLTLITGHRSPRHESGCPNLLIGRDLLRDRLRIHCPPK